MNNTVTGAGAGAVTVTEAPVVSGAGEGIGEAILAVRGSREVIETEASAAILVLGDHLTGSQSLRVLCEGVPRVRSGKALYDTLFVHADSIVAANAAAQSRDAATPLVLEEEPLGAAAADPDPVLEEAVIFRDLGDPKDINWAKYRKVYVLADGEKGLSIITSGSSAFNPSDLAQRLDELGVLNAVKDIRITSNGSGEAFECNLGPSIAEGICTVLGGSLTGLVATLLTGPVSSKPTNPFAEDVQKRLKEKGHEDITVTGYKGELKFESRSTHHLRKIDNIKERRSKVSIKFGPANGAAAVPVPEEPALEAVAQEEERRGE